MLLAAIPWGVMQVDRGLRRVLRFGGIWLVVAALMVVAVIPLALEGARQQPVAQAVDELRDGVSSLSSWARMEGTIVTISSPEAVESGQRVASLLVEPSGDAIMLFSDHPIDHLTMVTGRVNNSFHAAQAARGIAGPRLPAGNLEIIDSYVLSVDDAIVPIERRTWIEVWLPLLIAAIVVASHLVSYPVLTLRRREHLGSARPLAAGESLPLHLVQREDENGLRMTAPRGRLVALARHAETDPYFSLDPGTGARPVLFRRHRWSSAVAGTLWYARQRVPVVTIHDWSVDALLGADSPEDCRRVLASFAKGGEEGPAPEAARAVAKAGGR